MPDPDESVKLRELWDVINKARMDISEMKGMITMHFRSDEHHHPPCSYATNLQKVLFSSLFAALLALLAALGNIAVAVVTR